ncbi:MAG: hypothetical protein ACERLG_06825 [Sedimentibacter sp.]
MKSEKYSSKTMEWRIKNIPFCDSFAMMKTNWGAIIGSLLFVGGIFAGFKASPLFSISIIGLFFTLISILFRGRIERKNWEKVLAQCTDREWKSVLSLAGSKGGVRDVWAFQLLCEFELGGKMYTVTPGYWSTFISESQLLKFLNKVITSEGKCMLLVNPKNPLEAELIANDIKDFLLH